MDRDRLEVVLTTLQTNREEIQLESPGMGRMERERVRDQALVESPGMTRTK